jgi:opacity protein-like surface antigen
VQTFGNFDHHQTNSAFVWPASWHIDQKDIGDSAFIGFGIGYAWSNWLRFDVTAEHRAETKVKVLGSYTEFCPSGRCFDVYDLSHGSNVFLANAYVDLGTWWCLTPFVGFGVGTANNNFRSATDVGIISDGSTGFGYAASNNNSTWNFAWAAHAGLAYTVSSNFKVEFAYRYLNMGSPHTAVIDCNSGGCGSTGGASAYYSLKNLSSNDFKIGLRWSLQPDVPAYAPPPPLMRRG